MALKLVFSSKRQTDLSEYIFLSTVLNYQFYFSCYTIQYATENKAWSIADQKVNLKVRNKTWFLSAKE